MKATIVIHCVILAVMDIKLISAAGNTATQLGGLVGHENETKELAGIANNDASSDMSEKSAETQSLDGKEAPPGPRDMFDETNEVREQEQNETEIFSQGKMQLNILPRVRRYAPYGNGRGIEIEKNTQIKPKHRSNNVRRSKTGRRNSAKKSKKIRTKYSKRVSSKAQSRSQSDKVAIQFVPEVQ